MRANTSQPWISSAWNDAVFILLPPFLSLLIVLLFPNYFQNSAGIPDASWVILILLVDVAHVYSTLYRTYFDPHALKDHRSLLWSIPFLGFIGSVVVYAISAQLFWRLLAYTAVFHFIRQQYGFMRVYARKEPKHNMAHAIDTFTIYYAAIYPLLYWHLNGPRNFNWFTDGDFVFFEAAWLLRVATAVYYLCISAFIIKEVVMLVTFRSINLPKFFIVAGTLLSWYFGIVYFNGDMAFTLLNVVSHGIPYMALVWFYGKKHYTKPASKSNFLSAVFSRYGIVIFLGSLFLFAFIEEGVWDIAVWKEHTKVFGSFGLGNLTISKHVLNFLVPLLALPQLTHYILDGFIWKIKNDDFRWSGEKQQLRGT